MRRPQCRAKVKPPKTYVDSEVGRVQPGWTPFPPQRCRRLANGADGLCGTHRRVACFPLTPGDGGGNMDPKPKGGEQRSPG